MDIWYIILVLLVTARLFSEMARRFSIPPLAGELVAGIILGIIFNTWSGTFTELSNLHDNEVFTAITEFGMFFLMLYAGVELNFKNLKKASGNAVWVALGGMLIPLALGMGLGWFTLPESELKSAQLFFIGVALAITAVPVAIKALMDINLLNTKEGQTIVSAAVIDDVISLVLLAVLTAFLKTGEMPGFEGILILIGKIILFFIITIVVGLYALPYLLKLVSKKINIEESEVSFLLIVAFSFAVLAEALDLHFILGAFIAGLFFTKREMKKSVYEDVKNKIGAINTGFLAPIFFASIGLSLELSAFVNIPLFVVALILIASVGKIIGAGIPAKLSGLSTQQSLIVGNAMNARGAVELIIADIALRAGLFKLPGDSHIVQNLFSAVVIMAIVTTLVTPIILKKLGKRKS
ncbi:MAG: cation:proton antiporter [Marinilabiliales bacterium]|nr:MAG: cation:proton antiporter [Marinilabiliales bacterium]